MRGEARQLPHVMILPQVSDDVPRHYHPVYRRIADNREYILKMIVPLVHDECRGLFTFMVDFRQHESSMSKSTSVSRSPPPDPSLPPVAPCPYSSFAVATTRPMCRYVYMYLREECNFREDPRDESGRSAVLRYYYADSAV